MLAIASATILSQILKTGCDPGLVPILQRYQPLMLEADLAVLYIVQPGDRAGDAERTRGRPFRQWEFIAEEGGWFEAVFVLDDFGRGHVVLIPDSTDCDPELLTICREHAVSNS